MTLRWFFSKTVRQASAMRKHVEKLINHQRDILSPKALETLRTATSDLRRALAENVDQAALEKQMEKVETAANTWLKPYPNASARENVEVLLVAIAVAMAIRTFFLQPFKIPTGSMQPTLFGITSDNLIGRNDIVIPNPLARFFIFWFRGISYTHVVAKADGILNWAEESPKKFLLFNLKQSFKVGDES